jgi:signal transduction histidine kinase
MDAIFISLITVFTLCALLSYSIWHADRRIYNVIFSFFILCVGLWALGIYGFLSSSNLSYSLFFANFNYLIASIIPAFFVHFSIIFLNEENDIRKNHIYIYIPSIVFLILVLNNSHAFLTDINIVNYGTKDASINLIYYLLYSTYFVGYVSYSYYILIKKYFNSLDISNKTQLKYILIGTAVPFILATLFDLILPPFNYHFVWVGPLLGFVVIIVIVYAIYKHNLLKVRFLSAQLLIGTLWIFVFIRTLITQNPKELIANIILLFTFIIFGSLLIKSAVKEEKQKNEIQKLAESLRILNLTLEQKVAEQTAEVKKAFEMEKGVRRELEKLNETKDQFIMITQHNLRTPVTSIRWETEALMKGERGAINEEAMTSIRNIDICTRRLLRLVDDFLNITAIRTGSEILEISRANMKTILEQVLSELKIDIGNMNINITYPKDDRNWPEIDVDISKIHEVVLIIIENAIRYNRKDGEIKISTERSVKNMHGHESEVLQIFIENTGVGITKEERNNLFTRLFYRSKKAQDTHPIGMGIGLSVARAIVRAHRGEITIESPGENMGATVTVTLPFLNDSRKHHSLPQ